MTDLLDPMTDLLWIDEYFTRSDSSGEHTLLAGTLASTLALMDNAATVQTQYVYEPFGKTATIGQSSLNSFQYTGRENDGLGIYYYRARYYNPTLQRFISEDPIGFYGGDSNFYAYVRNRPIVWRDPWGTIGISDIGLVFDDSGPGGCYGGVIGGVVGGALGTGLGIGGVAAGALGGGLLGSHLGGIIDHYFFPCAGQLNCDEGLPPAPPPPSPPRPRSSY